MEVMIFYALLALLFVIQLLLCFKVSNKYVKLIPIFLIIIGLIICCIVYATTNKNHIFFGNDFWAFITGLILCMGLAVDGLAWGCYFVYNFVRKRKKNTND